MVNDLRYAFFCNYTLILRNLRKVLSSYILQPLQRGLIKRDKNLYYDKYRFQNKRRDFGIFLNYSQSK